MRLPKIVLFPGLFQSTVNSDSEFCLILIPELNIILFFVVFSILKTWIAYRKFLKNCIFTFWKARWMYTSNQNSDPESGFTEHNFSIGEGPKNTFFFVIIVSRSTFVSALFTTSKLLLYLHFLFYFFINSKIGDPQKN